MNEYISRKELNDYYKSLYQKDFPASTLSKWKKDGRIRTLPMPEKPSNFLYNFKDFSDIVTSANYSKSLHAAKENPKNYIGKMSGNLLITGIVPRTEYQEPNYKGTLMYCKCLACNRPDLIQVRFSYLTPNGNYQQKSCGCDRKQKAFLATSRSDVPGSFIKQYSDKFDYYLMLHKMLIRTVGEGYYTKCSLEEYLNAITVLDKQRFGYTFYQFWQNQNRLNTFYDLSKPSLDHIIPKARGGTNDISNLQILTVYENLCKRDMTWEEWCQFKKDTHATSDYFIEKIVKGREGE